jgi:hypothetical protein
MFTILREEFRILYILCFLYSLYLLNLIISAIRFRETWHD